MEEPESASVVVVEANKILTVCLLGVTDNVSNVGWMMSRISGLGMNEHEKERVEVLSKLAAQRIVKLKADRVELTQKGKRVILNGITEDMLFWVDILHVLEGAPKFSE